MKYKKVLLFGLLFVIFLGFLFSIRKENHLLAPKSGVFENSYRDTAGGYVVSYPKDWFLKDITSDPLDEVVSWNSAVLISDQPITGTREGSHLPSYGLLILSKPKDSQIHDCPVVKGVSEPAGSILIAGEERERCLDIAGNDTYAVTFKTEKNVYTFLYPKNIMDEVVINRILSSFKILP